MALSRCVVVKLGGEIVRSHELPLLARDLVALQKGGHAIVVVHGGGPQVTELQRRLGQEPTIVAGRRVTDAAALEALKMSVAGAVNVDLCAALVAAGGSPVGLHGASALVVRANKRPPVVVAGGGDTPIDFGCVGDVVGVNESLLALLLGAGHIPVVACLAADERGAVYNINADAVASHMARALDAEALVLVTDVAAVLSDPSDPSTRIERLTQADAKQAIAAGRIRGGMIPKLTEGFGALEQGVRSVLVVGKLRAGDLARAVTSPGAVGTVLTN
ncbi:MAG TPA: acetylglutamate kinase [Polyangiaceae bacterium]|nr:acetylglutamate kinase [Polyangiaceae bacterium]